MTPDTNSDGDQYRKLPFWLVNIPEDQWPADCPEFLIGLDEKDMRIIGTPDELYKKQTWDDCLRIIRSKRIGDFHRVPSDLRRYREYTAKLKREYGSILNFILKERLRWDDLTPSGPPFTNPDDLKILYNDWPYGLESNIIHIVIWTKFDIPENEETGDVTDVAREQIEKYMEKTFHTKLPPEDVAWFKNWRSLKSVHAVEHFHVLLREPDMEFVDHITGGDVPLAAKVASGEI